MSQTEQKKSKTLLYILGGCAILSFIFIALIIVGFFIFGKKIHPFLSNPSKAIAKVITESNPDVEIVSIDEQNKKITIKNKKTGEVITIDFSDASKGNIVWKEKGGKGSFTISSDEEEGKIEFKEEGKETKIEYGKDKNLPKWLPELNGFEVKNVIRTESEGKKSGIIEIENQKNFEEAVDNLNKEFEKKGIILQKSFFQESEGKRQAMLQGKSKDNKYNAIIYVLEEDEKIKGTINYSEED